MSTKTYYVRAYWDEKAAVFYSKSNVPGLVIEADTLPEFVAIAEQLVPELLRDNDIKPAIARAAKPASAKPIRPSVELEYACA
jgi:hypothetical protein